MSDVKMLKATSSSTWTGSWKQGNGNIATATPTVQNEPYSFSSRFEGTAGAVPEELLAAAHAGCYNQALANNFDKIKFTAKSITTSVSIVYFINEEGRPTIKSSDITTVAQADGITEADFQTCAEKARIGCNISRILSCDINLKATLQK